MPEALLSRDLLLAEAGELLQLDFSRCLQLLQQLRFPGVDSLLDLGDELGVLRPLSLSAHALILNLLPETPQLDVDLGHIEGLSDLIDGACRNECSSVARANLKLAIAFGHKSTHRACILFQAVDRSHVCANFHTKIIGSGLEERHLVGQVGELFPRVSSVRLELLRGHGQILAVQSVGLSLLAPNCLDISLKFREERFSHSCEFALGLGFLID